MMSFFHKSLVRSFSFFTAVLLIVSCLAFPTHPAQAAGTQTGKVINVSSSLNVRSDASTSSSIVATLLPSSVVSVLGEKTGTAVTDNGQTSSTWYQIKTAGGITGYVSSLFLEVTTDYSGWVGTVINVTSSLNVRSDASTNSSILTSLSTKEKVSLLGETEGESVNGITLWYKIKTAGGVIGFVNSYFLSVSENSADNVNPDPDVDSFQTVLNQFPESYWDGLTALHEQYPNWVFQPTEVSLSWDYVIDKEVQDNYSLTSLIEAPKWTAVPSSYKCCESYAFNWSTGEWIKKDNGSLVCASRELIEYYMDPRSFMDTTYIFQFLEMSFDSNTQTVSGVQAILDGSFMEGELPDEPGTTYAECIYEASKTYGANPYVIAAKLLGEQGRNGSALTSGTYAGYEGYYNYFNYNAYGNGSAAIIQNGLSYAKKQGWDTHRKSIEGGTQKYVSGYIAGGQSTPYLTRFDVLGSKPFTHQYASDICYAWSEASKISKIYTAEIRNQSLTFSIPVYQNMPESACTKPSGNTSPYLKLKSLTVSTGSISPRFQPEITSYTITVPIGTQSVSVTPVAMDSSAKVTGGKIISVGDIATITVTSRYGGTKNYTIQVVSSALNISSVSLTLDGGIAVLSENSTADEVINASGSSTSKVFSSGTEKIGATLVSTDDILVMYDSSGASLGAYSLVVLGDVNQDGRQTTKDVSYLFHAYTQQMELSEAQLRAVNATDGLKLRDIYRLYSALFND